MPKLLTYKDLSVHVLHATPNPCKAVGLAIAITQKKLDDVSQVKEASPELLKFVYDANHGSVLEHCVISFYIKNVSRSFLAQITRHRMASYTSASQHYQDYRDYPIAIDGSLTPPQGDVLCDAIEEAINDYTVLVDVDGIPPQEARQCLPNACCVNMVWTINARSLANFLNLRECKRNTNEMRIFAARVDDLAMEWFPELFHWVGPDCYERDCKQGKMACGKPFARRKNDYK